MFLQMAEPNPDKMIQMPNIYAQPPPLHPASTLYPLCTDPLIPYVPAEHQMWSISHERKLNKRDFINTTLKIYWIYAIKRTTSVQQPGLFNMLRVLISIQTRSKTSFP